MYKPEEVDWNNVIGNYMKIEDVIGGSFIIRTDTILHVIIDKGYTIDKYITAYDLYNEGNGKTLSEYDCKTIYRSKLNSIYTSIINNTPIINIEGSTLVNTIGESLLYEFINLRDKINDEIVVFITAKNKEVTKFNFKMPYIPNNLDIDSKYNIIINFLINELGKETYDIEYELKLAGYSEEHERSIHIDC